jgi:ferredoxin--NADP+ reductase
MTLTETTSETDFPVPVGIFAQEVTSVEHYTDRLFKFRITRPDSFRFRSGEFVMIGLPNAEKPVFRAYSIASQVGMKKSSFIRLKWKTGH